MTGHKGLGSKCQVLSVFPKAYIKQVRSRDRPLWCVVDGASGDDLSQLHYSPVKAWKDSEARVRIKGG